MPHRPTPDVDITRAAMAASLRDVYGVAGTLWEDVVAEATRCGVPVLHGSSPDVGGVGHACSAASPEWGQDARREADVGA